MNEASSGKKLLLVIPAYNEAESIEKVVDELILGYPQYDYVVVLDGPTDGTDEICMRRGYNCLPLPENLGLRDCFRHGMRYALDRGYDFALQFDGDGQHRPEYIKAMLEKALAGYDIVLGSRFLGSGAGTGDMSFMRKLGSLLIRKSIKMRTGADITDPTCGLRLYDRRMIRHFSEDSSSSPEPDYIAALVKEGATIAEVPVTVGAREAGSSYLAPLTAFRYMKNILGNILKL